MVREQEKHLIRQCIDALREGIPGFKSRRPQMEMIAAVANTLSRCRAEDEQAGNGDHLAIVEAGTGTGKSFGALVPALVMAKSRQKRLVVSSSTVALQHQYAEKDAPSLQRLVPIPFTFAVAKGRRRYACTAKLQAEGKEVVVYLCGQRAINFYKFRHRTYAAEWSGFSDAPQFHHAKAIADRLVADFTLDIDAGGNDEVHIVYTRFKSMVTQEPRVLRLVPLEVIEGEASATPEVLPLYSFEPSVEEVLDALLPKYVTNRIYTCLLGSAASQLAAQQRAMKSATDNADTLIKTYTRLANQARQAEITQEISEIVGGANALASA